MSFSINLCVGGSPPLRPLCKLPLSRQPFVKTCSVSDLCDVCLQLWSFGAYTHKDTHTKYTQTHTKYTQIHTHPVSAALMSLLAKPRLLREVADDPSRAHYQPSPQPHSPTSEFTCYTSHMAYVSSPVIDFSLKSWQLTFVFFSFYA